VGTKRSPISTRDDGGHGTKALSTRDGGHGTKALSTRDGGHGTKALSTRHDDAFSFRLIPRVFSSVDVVRLKGLLRLRRRVSVSVEEFSIAVSFPEF
jgi:hypothetical protein